MANAGHAEPTGAWTSRPCQVCYVRACAAAQSYAHGSANLSTCCCSVFAWNLLLTGHPKAIPGKIRRDLPPTIVNGWKFWIPVSAANFRVIPLQQQVKLCGHYPSLMRPASGKSCNCYACGCKLLSSYIR